MPVADSSVAVPREIAPPRIGGALVALLVVLVLTVTGLTAAIVTVRSRPEPLPATKTESDVRSWERLVRENPASPVVHTGLGLALLRAGHPGDAEESFEQALELDPATSTAALQLGRLIRDREPERAERLFKQAAKSARPGDKAAAFFALGELRLANGDLEGARKAYENSVADGPTFIESRVGLAETLERLGDKGGALEQYREAARFGPGNSDLADAIARLEEETQ